jgi:hypothetical protein
MARPGSWVRGESPKWGIPVMADYSGTPAGDTYTGTPDPDRSPATAVTTSSTAVTAMM